MYTITNRFSDVDGAAYYTNVIIGSQAMLIIANNVKRAGTTNYYLALGKKSTFLIFCRSSVYGTVDNSIY